MISFGIIQYNANIRNTFSHCASPHQAYPPIYIRTMKHLLCRRVSLTISGKYASHFLITMIKTTNNK